MFGQYQGFSSQHSFDQKDARSFIQGSTWAALHWNVLPSFSPSTHIL